MNVRNITKQMTQYGKTFGLAFFDKEQPIHQAICLLYTSPSPRD